MPASKPTKVREPRTLHFDAKNVRIDGERIEGRVTFTMTVTPTNSTQDACSTEVPRVFDVSPKDPTALFGHIEMEVMPSSVHAATADLRKSLAALDTARRGDSQPRGGHISLIALGEWADRDRPEEFVAQQSAGEWSAHLKGCEKCRGNIEFFSRERNKYGT